MLESGILVTWLVILNIAALSLFLYSWAKLPRSGHRTTFLLFLIPYSVWANCLFVIQLIGSADPFSRLVSQSIFASGAFYHVLLGYLLISLAAPQQVLTIWFQALMCNTIVVGILAYSGLWEEGVSFDPQTGLAPIASPNLWYFNISLLAWALYYFSTIIVAYARMKSRDILRCQLKVLVWPAVFSMTMSLTTNVVIPQVTGNYSLTAIGGFWLFVFFAAIAYIIKLGKVILLYQAVREFESRLAIGSGPSYDELGALVRASIVRSRAVIGLYPPSLSSGGYGGQALPWARRVRAQ